MNSIALTEPPSSSTLAISSLARASMGEVSGAMQDVFGAYAPTF